MLKSNHSTTKTRIGDSDVLTSQFTYVFHSVNYSMRLQDLIPKIWTYFLTMHLIHIWFVTVKMKLKDWHIHTIASRKAVLEMPLPSKVTQEVESHRKVFEFRLRKIVLFYQIHFWNVNLLQFFLIFRTNTYVTDKF